MYTYLLLNIFCLAGPLALSFDKKVAFFRKWKYLLPAILLNALLFLVWDHFFTRMGVWSFNENYITGIKFWMLPLEEILFFFTVPYACIFIYDCANFYIKKDFFYRARKWIGWALFLLCLLLFYLYIDRLYTAVTTLSLAFLLLLVFSVGNKEYMGRFFMAYLISLIPFLVVNGILTSLPVVSYSDIETTGIRIFTIPAEDLFYNMLMFLFPVVIYEKARRLY